MATAKTVLLAQRDRSGSTIEVLEAENHYTVVYRDKPFNMRQLPQGYGTIRYRRTSFSNHGHAMRLARRLNALFDTFDFTVVEAL